MKEFELGVNDAMNGFPFIARWHGFPAGDHYSDGYWQGRAKLMSILYRMQENNIIRFEVVEGKSNDE